MSIRNRITRSLAMVSARLLVGGSAMAAQQAPPSVSVTGAVSRPLTLTSADLETMSRATVTTTNNGI